MNFDDLSRYTLITSDQVPVDGMQVVLTTPMAVVAQPAEEKVLSDDDVINMVGDLEEDCGGLSTIDYDFLKLAPDAEYTDLVPAATHYEDVSATAPVISPENLSHAGSPPIPSPSYFESAQFSPVSSPLSLFSNRTELEGNIEESITLVVSPSDVMNEQKKAPTGKKRGRKPKSEKALHDIQSATKKIKKVKIYEIAGPFADKEKERKRLNAVNAKRHRDLQKQAKECLEKQLQEVKAERDQLKTEVETLRAREITLAQQLEQFKNHIKSQQDSALALLQATKAF